MKRLTEISPIDAAKLGAFLYGSAGMIFLVAALFSEEKSMTGPFGVLLPYFFLKFDLTFRGISLLLGPFSYAVSGAISIAFAALAYNIFAGLMGGLRISVRE